MPSFKFIERIKKKKLNWSLHTTDIFTAVAQGLLDKILGRKASREEKEEWLQQEKADCFDEITWEEEYCCNAQDEGDAFIPYDEINLCVESNLLWEQNIIPVVWNGKDIKEPQNPKSRWVHDKLYEFEKWVQSLNPTGYLFLGYDVGRRKDLTVVKVIEKVGFINILRGYFVLEKMKFWVQRKVVFALLSHPKMYRGCIDETGMGIQIAEEAVDEFGEFKVEAINFAAGTIRNEMAFYTKSCFEDRSVLIPDMDEIKDDIHSIKKITTAANKIRLDADTDTKVTGHADRFWALSLALHAASDANAGPIIVSSRKKRESTKMLEGYAETINSGLYRLKNPEILPIPVKVWLKNNLRKFNCFFKSYFPSFERPLKSILSISAIYERIKGNFKFKPLGKGPEILIIFNQGSAIFNHYPEFLTADLKKKIKNLLKVCFSLKNEFAIKLEL